MTESREIPRPDCERLLRAGVVGRFAVTTPEGPHVVPVNYAVFDDTVVALTASSSLLGRYGPGATAAFEVDHVDHERHVGWSVLARGRAWAEDDPEEVARMRASWPPRPWAGGERDLYLRLRWTHLSGRWLGTDWDRGSESPVQRTVTAL